MECSAQQVLVLQGFEHFGVLVCLVDRGDGICRSPGGASKFPSSRKRRQNGLTPVAFFGSTSGVDGSHVRRSGWDQGKDWPCGLQHITKERTEPVFPWGVLEALVLSGGGEHMDAFLLLVVDVVAGARIVGLTFADRGLVALGL